MWKPLIVVFCLFISKSNNAQKFSYTEPEKEDTRNMNVEIIGKFGTNYIAYKNGRSENYIVVYQSDLKLKEKTKITILPTRVINTDFVSYQNYFYLVYQHQKKSIIYCEALKFNADGKLMEEKPILLDTTSIPTFTNDNKIYSVQVSDNKQRIAIIKGNKKNERNHNIGMVLLDANLKQLYKKFYTIPMDGKNNFLKDFTIDNTGDLFFAKCFSNVSNDLITRVDVYRVSNNGDSIKSKTIPTEDKTLDEIVLKMDNQNQKLIIQSFYLTKKRGNVDGIMVGFLDKQKDQVTKPVFTKFADSFRIEAKGLNNTKFAFNDFFIKDVFVRKDGGFITTSESAYTQGRGNAAAPWSRWDYFGSSPYMTSYDYYNMGGRTWMWNNWERSSNMLTYIAENIAVKSFDKDGNMLWSNIVHKNQSDDGQESFISHQAALFGGSLHFLFNEKDRNDFLMYDNSISPNGIVTRHPTLKNLNRDYQIVAKQGKQVSAREIIFPCIYKNYVCFAKLDY